MATKPTKKKVTKKVSTQTDDLVGGRPDDRKKVAKKATKKKK